MTSANQAWVRTSFGRSSGRLEGATVTVMVPEDEQGFALGPEEEAELLAAMEQIRQGEVVDGDELIRELREQA
jgi:hypothetical protein